MGRRQRVRGGRWSVVVVVVVMMMLLRQISPTEALDPRVLSSLFNSKMSDLYKMRETLQESLDDYTTTTTSTTSTTKTSPSTQFAHPPKWPSSSQRGAANVDDVYLSLSGLFDNDPLRLQDSRPQQLQAENESPSYSIPSQSLLVSELPALSNAEPQRHRLKVSQTQSHSVSNKLHPSEFPQFIPAAVPQSRLLEVSQSVAEVPQSVSAAVPQPQQGAGFQSRPAMSSPDLISASQDISVASIDNKLEVVSLLPSVQGKKEIFYGIEGYNSSIHLFQVNNSIDNTNAGNGTEASGETHWARIKSIFENMKSILQQMYPPESNGEKMSFSIFDHIISFGDKVHLINRMSETFDGELMDYLYNKWDDVKSSVVASHPLMQAVLSSNTQTMGYGLLMVLVKKLGSVLQTQAFTHISELDFVTELMRSSGFKDTEIYQVFKLLDLPTTTVESSEEVLAEARQFGWGGYTMEKSDGYGHSGGGGGMGYGGGGGGYMQSFDPFVLLAGLAFATFLAYLIYRLLSSTTGGRRAVPDISLALDLSDLPSVMGNLYSWLENTESLYGRAGKGSDDETHNFGWAANQLWSSYQVDRLSHACVKRFMCDYVADTNSGGDLVDSGSLLQEVALSSMAQLFGEEDVASTVDRVHSQMLEGNDPHCATLAPQCDDVAYPGVRTRVLTKDTEHKNGTGQGVLEGVQS